LRLFAISDIHGCLKPFRELVVNVIDLKKTDRLILLGDYVDRGAESRQVIDFILELKKTGFDVVVLRGNHEQMMLESWRNTDTLPLWFLNSGMATLESFGVRDVRDIPEEYMKFISDMPFYHEEHDLLFVHAGFNDSAPDPFSDNHSMIWECRPTYINRFLTDRIIIHGHRPRTVESVKKLIAESSRVIPIDTGCVYDHREGYGKLSALEVHSMTLYSV
jgi:serine/threonine protein phosphatase 1